MWRNVADFPLDLSYHEPFTEDGLTMGRLVRKIVKPGKTFSAADAEKAGVSVRALQRMGVIRPVKRKAK
ncbi:MAG: hypothetical protein ACE5EQ_11780 [Phycisphaerae bacterium]